MSLQPLLPSTSQDDHSQVSFRFHQEDVEVGVSQLPLARPNELVVAKGGSWHKDWALEWGRRKFVDPLVAILQRGLEPKLLSLSAALGITFGVFPICGVPLLFCGITAVVLQNCCHVPTLMLGHFASSFLELWLLVPFMRVGELALGGEHIMISSNGFWEAFRAHEPRALVICVLHAVIGWSIFAPFSVAALYICLLPLFQFLNERFSVIKQFHPNEPCQIATNERQSL